MFGFLGPNGAGKTTTLKLLMQLVYPTSGRRTILGRPLGDLAMKRRIGYLPENPYFYDYLTAEELLAYFAGLFGYRGAERTRARARLLDDVGLGAERRMQLRKFSKGMIQRVGLAQALINDPEVVFLDEPMSGLDPLGRRDVRALILRLRDEGRRSSSARTSCRTPRRCAAGRDRRARAAWPPWARSPSSSPRVQAAGRSSSTGSPRRRTLHGAAHDSTPLSAGRFAVEAPPPADPTAGPRAGRRRRPPRLDQPRARDARRLVRQARRQRRRHRSFGAAAGRGRSRRAA